MSPIATAVSLLILVLGHESAATPRTIDDVLKDRGLPLFAATDVRIQSTWDEMWPVRANRLVTTGFRTVENNEQMLRCAGEVLIYCAESGESRELGDLILRLHAIAEQMAHSSPQAGELLGPPSLPLKAPMKVALVFVDRQGRVRRLEQHAVIELKSNSRGD